MMNQLYFDKIIELYKLNLENQHNQYNLLITVIIGVFIALLGALLGFNWYWNKRQIENKIKKIETKFTTIKKEIHDEYEEYFKTKQVEIYKTFLEQQAHLSALTEFIFQIEKNYPYAIYYCCQALLFFTKLNNSTAEEGILANVNLFIKLTQVPEVVANKKIYKLEETKTVIRSLPVLLNDKKVQMLAFLDQCTDFVVPQ